MIFAILPEDCTHCCESCAENVNARCGREIPLVDPIAEEVEGGAS